MASNLFDVIVIGGGMAGVHTVYPLTSSGLDIALIDGGQSSDTKAEEWHFNNFEDIRRDVDTQHKLFLGKDLSGISLDNKDHSSSMTSGSRSYITRMTDEFLPFKSDNINVLQSLAMGGLGEAWGAVCEVFNESEIKAVGLPVNDILTEYQEVINLIGVSGERAGFKLMPATVESLHVRMLLKKYAKNKNNVKSLVKRSMLAVLTQKLNNRKPTIYNDMDFWTNYGDAVYRPSLDILNFVKNGKIKYFGGVVVERFEEKKDKVVIYGVDLESREKVRFMSKKVILAAGAVNSTRIALSSFSFFDKKAPFLYKQNIIIPSFHLCNLDSKNVKHQLSLCQLVMEGNAEISGVKQFYAQIYTYKSLLLHKLLSYIPLPVKESMSLLSLLSPYLLLVDVRLPNFLNPRSYLELKKRGNLEYIYAHAELSSKIDGILNEVLRTVGSDLQKMGVVKIKEVFQKKGSSAHYAGGIPFKSIETMKYPLTAELTGRLTNSKNIYVADASTWLALPAKPHSLTVMANSRRVGKVVLSTFS